MTTEEQANKLIETFRPLFGELDTILNKRRAQNAAIFCVDEILNEYKSLEKVFNAHFKQLKYWQSVKEEIYKL